MPNRPWNGPRAIDPDAGIMDRPMVLQPATGPITVTLPVPPSVNELFYNRKAGTRGKGRIKTAVYREWLAAATYDLRKQANAVARVDGRYLIDIRIGRSSTRADIWNLEKAISDFLQTEKVIANDNLCDGGSIRWSDETETALVTVQAA